MLRLRYEGLKGIQIDGVVRKNIHSNNNSFVKLLQIFPSSSILLL